MFASSNSVVRAVTPRPALIAARMPVSVGEIKLVRHAMPAALSRSMDRRRNRLSSSAITSGTGADELKMKSSAQIHTIGEVRSLMPGKASS